MALEFIPHGSLTPHPQCFSGHDDFKTDEFFPIEAYRKFYRVDKLRFARYKYTNKPPMARRRSSMKPIKHENLN
jgi:hypothetical protein